MALSVGIKVAKKAYSPCLAPSRARPSARPLHVVAFRDTHREETVVGVGSEVLHAWIKGVQKVQSPHATFSQDCDTCVTYKKDQVLLSEQGRGVPFLLSHIERESQKMDVVNYRILATAACPHDDTFFALVEMTYRKKAEGEEPTEFTTMKLFEMDMLVDDTVRRVTAIHEWGQLDRVDMQTLAPEMCGTLACGPPSFPESDMKPYPSNLKPGVVMDTSRKWCKARTSGKSEDVLDSILHPSFRLWDAYGMLPVLCDPTRTIDEGVCIVPFENVKDIIKQTKERYDIDCHLIDNAVSMSSNVAFAHWRSHITNRETEEAFTVDGVEVELFDDDGRIKDIFLFRDPMDTERSMLQGKMDL